ncbi:MAG: glycosyltransferase family 61 protein [Rhodospirillaceae bacterium]|nr:glycosyltransferase family 61 protein [Rhodospirillaceae bacterium]
MPRPDLRPDRELKSGVLIGNRFTWNYFHWITEGLAAAALAEEQRFGLDHPFIVKEMPAQSHRLLELLFPERKVHVVAPDSLLRIERAFLPHAGLYCPDDPAESKKAVFDPEGLSRVRRRVVPLIEEFWKRPRTAVYASRQKLRGNLQFQQRHITNEPEIEERIRRLHGRIIHAETMSIEAQMETFASAGLVVLPAGAAVANLLFCRPGTKALVLCKNERITPEIFVIAAEVCGVELALVCGEPVREEDQFIHEGHLSYSIAMPDLDNAIESALQGTSFA